MCACVIVKVLTAFQSMSIALRVATDDICCNRIDRVIVIQTVAGLSPCPSLDLMRTDMLILLTYFNCSKYSL